MAFLAVPHRQLAVEADTGGLHLLPAHTARTAQILCHLSRPCCMVLTLLSAGCAGAQSRAQMVQPPV